MALITKELTVIVEGNTASLDEELYIYQGDRGVSVYFTVADSKFIFSEYDEANILLNSSAKYSMIRVKKPNGKLFTVGRTPIEDNRVLLYIDEDFADNADEIGTYYLQISLYDDAYGRVTIPPVTFNVLKPIYDIKLEMEQELGENILISNSKEYEQEIEELDRLDKEEEIDNSEGE